MSQQAVMQPPIDLDDEDEFLPVVHPPTHQSAQPPQTATAFSMVAQQTLLPVATSGRRRSRSPSMQSETRPHPRLRMVPRVDPGPAAERGRAWIPAPVTPTGEVPRVHSSFRTRHPSFNMSEASHSIPPTVQQQAATPPRARAKPAAAPRNTATAKEIEMEDRFGQLERRAHAAEERLNAAEQRIDATSRLAEKLDDFAAEVAKHSGR